MDLLNSVFMAVLMFGGLVIVFWFLLRTYAVFKRMVELPKVRVFDMPEIFIPGPPDSDDPPTLPLRHLAQSKAGDRADK